MAAKKNRDLQHRLEYYLTVILSGFFRILPAKAATALGMAIGAFAYRRLKIRREVALDNLKQAFPEKSPGEIEKIALDSYRHWGGVGAEYARLPRFNRRYYEKYIKLEGREALNAAVQGGKGGLVISGHYGNWEMIGASASVEGYKVTYVVASQSNKLVDKMMDDVRKFHGIEIWKTREAPRGMLKSLKNNRLIAIMIDQDAGKECVFVDFFGKKASTHRGPAVFHLKTGAPLMMSSCVRQKGPQYLMKFEEIVLPDFQGTREEINTQIMQYLSELLEAQIRRHPEQYFWMHKRWKTRPPEEKV